MHAEKDRQTALPAWWCTSRMHRRKRRILNIFGNLDSEYFNVCIMASVESQIL